MAADLDRATVDQWCREIWQRLQKRRGGGHHGADVLRRLAQQEMLKVVRDCLLGAPDVEPLTGPIPQRLTDLADTLRNHWLTAACLQESRWARSAEEARAHLAYVVAYGEANLDVADELDRLAHRLQAEAVAKGN